MSIHLDTYGRIAKVQKDVQEIEEDLEDQWHESRSNYEKRVRKTLQDGRNAGVLYLQIDGKRYVNIENPEV